MNGHRRLWVWQRSGDLIVLCYDLTRSLPDDERFVATPQLRRAAWSVQNNIAEGHARLGGREQRHLFDVSLSSLAEVDSMIGSLERIYELDPSMVERAEQFRREITAGVFSFLKHPRR